MDETTARDLVKAVFDDPKNITAGQARVIYAKACTPIHSPTVPEGWVLPGGARTQNRDEAAAVAMTMDWLMSGRRV